jgi:deoxyribonuclease IV
MTADLLGSHVSTAGGVAAAFQRAESVGCGAFQIFTKNNFQWSGKPLEPDEAAQFRALLAAKKMPVGAHSGYLINLGAASGPNLEQSIASMIEEIQRADLLGIPYVVLHPGSHLGAGEKPGIRTIAAHLKKILAATRKSKVRIALETTAGQGTCLGCRFEHLAELYERVGHPERLAICFDTCHVFAAGYDLAANPEKVLKEFDRVVGLKEIVMFHFNDSKGERGSRLDRHEHIGKGRIGLAAFRVILNERKLKKVPKILETPKDPAGKFDRMNLKLLRSMVRG